MTLLGKLPLIFEENSNLNFAFMMCMKIVSFRRFPLHLLIGRDEVMTYSDCYHYYLRFNELSHQKKPGALTNLRLFLTTLSDAILKSNRSPNEIL